MSVDPIACNTSNYGFYRTADTHAHKTIVAQINLIFYFGKINFEAILSFCSKSEFR